MDKAADPAKPEAQDENYAEYVRQYFAGDAVTYDQRERWRRRMRQMLLDLANPQPGETALDVCTGTGEVAHALAQRGATVTGLDLSLDMLGHARRKGDRIQFLEGDATHLPFPDRAFDLCTISMALHCMPGAIREPVLREMARVARKRVAIMEPNTPATATGRWLLARLGQWQHSPKYWGDFVSGDLRSLVAASALKVERRIVFNLGVHQAMLCRPLHLYQP